MDNALKALVKISNTVGKDSTLVQGGGGNTSAKTDDGKHMFIKASGTALKDMSETAGWRRLGLDSVLSLLTDELLPKLDVSTREIEVVNRLALACNDGLKTTARPSVEAHLHAMLDKFVIHLHPDAVLAYASAKDGKGLLEKLFADMKFPPLWVPYVDPGLTLAKKVASLVNDYKNEFGKMPQILFLEKHGLFVTADSENKALKLVKEVIARCEKKLKPLSAKVKNIDTQLVRDTKMAIRKAFFEATGDYTPVYFFIDEIISGFLARKDAKKLVSTPSLTPDELVYANGSPMWIDAAKSDVIAKKLSGQLENGQKVSKAFLVSGLGLFVAEKAKKAQIIHDIMASSLTIRTNAASLGGINTMTARQQDFVNNWEAEAFRSSVSGGAGAGALRDRIAVVTGAGSGLGKSIAVGLARAGAMVALADIDTAAAQQAAADIAAELPGSQTLVVPANVTSEDSVAQGFDLIVDTWGGLDILVNAAGVAPAAALTDLDVNKWRFALEVNLTGYFLMAKYAARIMIAQQMGGAIVNISSKSGVEASKNNSAYNATKAGELHLTRGWAMELGEHNIRVNSVCPGNVFEGSKIWNPEYIKVCAKKYGIKPEEVIPYYVSKTMLNREIKGQDIADSVVFLASDKARRITAQTIVADAGQAPVR